VSHHATQNDGRDSTSYEKAAANLIAGVILGIGQMIRAVFKTIFQILAAIA
jgi:hypothetical protein